MILNTITNPWNDMAKSGIYVLGSCGKGRADSSRKNVHPSRFPNNRNAVDERAHYISQDEAN